MRMKGIKRLVALAVGILMSTTVLTGCSADGMSLYKAFMKSQDVKTMEMQTDISLNISATNMSPQEEQMMAMVLPVINGTKISALTKVNQNEDKTTARIQSDIKMNIGQMPMDMSVWVDTDMTAEKPVMKEVIKMPTLFTAQAPAPFAGKEYMVMDLSEMMSVPGTPQLDYKKLAQFAKEFQPKFMEFFTKYAEQYNPGSVKISKVGQGKRITPYYYGSIDIYELKLSDKTLKELIRYTVNNFAENKEAMAFIKEYIISVMSVMGLPEQEVTAAKLEIEKAFTGFQMGLPEMMKGINDGLDKIESVKILGENGIVVKYAVNNKGYIIYEEGNAEIVIDLPGIAKLNGITEAKEGQPTGIYTINLKFSNDTRKINGLVDIEIPELNKTNSFNFTELLNLVPVAAPAQLSPVAVPVQ
jgi:hypothetical protein